MTTNQDPGNFQEIREKVRACRASVTILIGGASGVGKTTVAAELARHLDIRRNISTDLIREVIRKLQPENPALKGSTFALAGESAEDGPGYRERVVSGFLGQAKVVNLGVSAILDRVNKEGINIVIDGANFVPSLLGEAYLGSGPEHHVIPVVLTLHDRERHISRFRLRSEHSRRNAQRYIRKLDSILQLQEFLVEDAGRMGVAVVENEELETTLATILGLVDQTLPC